MITATTKLCMVIGDPIAHSLSPKMHNAAFKALGIDDQFAYVACKVSIDDIQKCIEGIRALNIRGVSCTIPHKTLVLPYLDRIDEAALAIGAVNTIVNTDGVLIGYNTDWMGILQALEEKTSLTGKKVAILGAGGAARAAMYAAKSKGAYVTLFARDLLKGKELANSFRVDVAHLSQNDEHCTSLIKNHTIIINATPVGMGDLVHQSPIAEAAIDSSHVVFDTVYKPRQTKLLRVAERKGSTIIEGIRLLLLQGVAQFTLYTGKEAPLEVMENVLYE